MAAPTQITFSWKDNSSDETGFEVWRRCWQDGGYRLLVVVPANTIVLTDFNLQPNTTYTYRVRAIGTEGISAWSNEITWRTPPAQ